MTDDEELKRLEALARGIQAGVAGICIAIILALIVGSILWAALQ